MDTIVAVLPAARSATAITREIQRTMAEASRLRRANQADPRIEELMREIYTLSCERMHVVHG